MSDRSGGARAPGQVTGAETRRLIAAAAAHSRPLTAFDWKVLAAVIAYTTSFGRLHDRVHLYRVAATVYAGALPDQRVDDEVPSWQVKKVGQALRGLGSIDPERTYGDDVPRGLIAYVPAKGRGNMSFVGVVPSTVEEKGPGVRGPLPEKGPGARGLNGEEKGPHLNGKGSSPQSEKGPDVRTPPITYPVSPGSEDPSRFEDMSCPACSSPIEDRRATRTSSNQPSFRCSNARCTGGSNGRPWASWDAEPPAKKDPIEQAQILARNRARVVGFEVDELKGELVVQFGDHPRAVAAGLKTFESLVSGGVT